MPQSRYRISSSFCNSFYDAYSSDTGSGYTDIWYWEKQCTNKEPGAGIQATSKTIDAYMIW